MNYKALKEKIHITLFMVSKNLYVCLLPNLTLTYIRSGKTEWAEICFRTYKQSFFEKLVFSFNHLALALVHIIFFLLVGSGRCRHCPHGMFTHPQDYTLDFKFC